MKPLPGLRRVYYGWVLVFALAFVIVNLAVDLAYGALDPRVSRQG